jgi:hypothetical protein
MRHSTCYLTCAFQSRCHRRWSLPAIRASWVETTRRGGHVTVWNGGLLRVTSSGRVGLQRCAARRQRLQHKRKTAAASRGPVAPRSYRPRCAHVGATAAKEQATSASRTHGGPTVRCKLIRHCAATRVDAQLPLLQGHGGEGKAPPPCSQEQAATDELVSSLFQQAMEARYAQALCIHVFSQLSRASRLCLAERTDGWVLGAGRMGNLGVVQAQAQRMHEVGGQHPGHAHAPCTGCDSPEYSSKVVALRTGTRMAMPAERVRDWFGSQKNTARHTTGCQRRRCSRGCVGVQGGVRFTPEPLAGGLLGRRGALRQLLQQVRGWSPRMEGRCTVATAAC